MVETAFLMQGVILAREYFSSKVDSREIQIRAIANELWRGVEWNWFAQGDNDASGLLWHWSPNYGWKKNLKIHGFNEAQSVYLLALASPTHPIQAKRYWNGWQSADYSLRREELGVPVELGRGLGPSLFCTHYSYLGFDPKQLSSGSKNYFEHFQDLCRVQIRYAESKQKERAGYGSMWGITASYGPDGYSDFAPGKKDNGTLAPTAALSSMPYVPAESRSCLAEMYNKHGKELWGPFGFCDSFNLQRNWVANDILGIDVGPIAPMIENYRTGFCWKTFMAAPEFQPLLKTLSMPPAATLK